MKRPQTEITVAAVPITSAVVNLDIISQKRYPENSPMKISIYKYPVPLLASFLLIFFHHYSFKIKLYIIKVLDVLMNYEKFLVLSSLKLNSFFEGLYKRKTAAIMKGISRNGIRKL